MNIELDGVGFVTVDGGIALHLHALVTASSKQRRDEPRTHYNARRRKLAPRVA